MKRRKYLGFLALSVSILLGGCASVATRAGYVKRAEAEGLLAKVKSEYAEKLAERDEQIKKENALLLAAERVKMQFAANALFGADFSFQTDPEQDRYDIVVNQRVNEARQVLPPPTLEAMAKETARVKEELDETKTSLEQLRANHEAKIKEADGLNTKSKELETSIALKEEEKKVIERKGAVALEAANQKIREADAKIIESQASDLAATKERQKERMWIIASLTFAALAAGAGAIFSPIMKKELGLFAAVCIGLAIAIPFVETWMVVCVGVLAIAVVAAPAIIRAIHTWKDHSNVLTAVQRVKESDPEVYKNTLKPQLTSWVGTKYDKDGNTVPDTAAIARIDETLRQIEEK